MDPLNLTAFLNRCTSVVLVQLSRSGELLSCNAGFQRLLDETTIGPWQLFATPALADLCSRQPDADNVVYEGLLNLGDHAGEMRTLVGKVYLRDGEVHVAAGYDMPELEQLSQLLLELNEELNSAQRDLVRLNRELSHSKEIIQHLSLTDSLTGIGNRRFLDETLDEEFARAKRYRTPLSMVMLDLDFFKKINDGFGHDAGDAVLRTLGRTIKHAVRQTDRAARFGGEEFVILMPGLNGPEAAAAAERLRGILEATHHGAVGVVTASFGVSTVEESDTVETLTTRADKALYQAKTQGRNCVVKF